MSGAKPVLAPAGPIDRFRDRYARLLEWLVAALMFVLFAEVTLGVVFRAIGAALIWYDEIASVKRAHISCPELLQAMSWRARRAINIVAEILVIAFFVLLGFVGAAIMPVLATDALVSVPSVPMSVVQSVIPISAALIVVAEVLHLVDLVRHAEPPAASGARLAEALQ
jgi:TRAP-type C4-dicarboxylate transport system permease small subunit